MPRTHRSSRTLAPSAPTPRTRRGGPGPNPPRSPPSPKRPPAQRPRALRKNNNQARRSWSRTRYHWHYDWGGEEMEEELVSFALFFPRSHKRTEKLHKRSSGPAVRTRTPWGRTGLVPPFCLPVSCCVFPANTRRTGRCLTHPDRVGRATALYHRHTQIHTDTHRTTQRVGRSTTNIPELTTQDIQETKKKKELWVIIFADGFKRRICNDRRVTGWRGKAPTSADLLDAGGGRRHTHTHTHTG